MLVIPHPDAIRAVYPSAEVQLGLVHVARSSLRFVPCKDRRTGAAGLKGICSAPTEEAALSALKDFRATWDEKGPTIGRSWNQRWTEIGPFLACAQEIREVIYSTNAVESLNFTPRKVTRNRQAIPTAEAAMKLVYMAAQSISRRWTMPVQDWSQALNQLAPRFACRVPI